MRTAAGIKARATSQIPLVGPGDLWLAIVLVALSNFFFGTGENIVAAFLPEIAGEAAAYVNPRSISEMTSQLGRLLESTEERARLAQVGRVRAECYRWERCAQESLAFFSKIAANERK